MSDVDRVADLDLQQAEVEGKKPEQLQAMRTAPGPGQSRGLLLLYPISRASLPKMGLGTAGDGGRRVALDAAEDVIGVGMVFPEATELTPQKYMTVDLSNVPQEILELPDEETEDDIQGTK